MSYARIPFGSSVQICRYVRHQPYYIRLSGWGRSVHGGAPHSPFPRGRTELCSVRQLASDAGSGESTPDTCSIGMFALENEVAKEIPSPITEGQVAAGAIAKALTPQLRNSRAFSVPIGGSLPYFISGLCPHEREADAGGLSHVSEPGSGETLAFLDQAAPHKSQPTDPPSHPELEGETSPAISIPTKGNPYFQRLQDRYDLLLLHPQAFGPQVQLLHKRIQRAQQQQSNQLHMRQLKALQYRIRTAGTGACLLVKPVVYAAFCVYSPEYIQIAAAKHVGAGPHFLAQYLKFKGLTKQKHRFDSFQFPRGAAGAEKWLAEASLQNTCVYPLEALSPQLRLFQSCAPERLAVWEEILGTALAC